jgi:hypothetical protein
MGWLAKGDSKKIPDGDDENPLRRLSEVLASSNDVEEEDPEEVEARLRNLSHGTNRD